MSKNYKKLYIGILITLCFSAFLLIFKSSPLEIKNAQQAETPIVISPAPTPSIKESAVNKAEPKELSAPLNNTENITVIAGEEKISLSVAPNTTFYDALVEAENIGKLAFSGKKYPGLGFFVTDIGTLHAGEGLDLLYYVNGKEATVGVSGYMLQDGDILEWKLE
ncbi:MAG: DUF4430 domain-containing protein [Minisyncoccia bacterium]